MYSIWLQMRRSRLLKPALLTLYLTCTYLISTTSARAVNSRVCSSSTINEFVQRLTQLAQNQIEELAQCGSVAVNPLVSALNSQDYNLARRAAYTLYLLGTTAKPAVPSLNRIILDTSLPDEFRVTAVNALQSIRPRDQDTIKTLLLALQDNNSELRGAAATALGNNSSGEKEVLEALLKIVDGTDSDSLRVAAVFALGNIAELHQNSVRSIAIQSLIKHIQDPLQSDRMIAGYLYVIDQLDLTDEVTINILIKLVSHQDTEIKERSAVALADITDHLYNKATEFSQINKSLEDFQKINAALKPINGENAPNLQQAKITVDARIRGLQDRRQALLMQLTQQYIVGNRSFWIIHPLFWLALIFAYPKSSRVQAIFFWNKYIREILGLWYVSALLTWVSPLRCRLFAPFKDSLLADAKLDSFDQQAFFSQSGVKLKDTDAIQPIQQVLPEIKGQIILEGESGLGKTMMLRHLVRQSKRITVYLPAQKCENGVIEAIQAKLHGQAQDADFLKKLIYSGAIDICIDGLNEVKPDVRANIKAFVESYFKGNIIMTTQPLLWNPPSTAKTYVLQPLHHNQIEQFLHLCECRLAQDAKLHGTDYSKACTQFLADALSAESSEADSAATRRILSNPMDLTIVAQMIGSGVQPDLFHLQEQQYKLMAEDYERSWNQPFPLKQFSEFVYQMRDKDEYAMTGESFYQTITIMEKEQHRMVLSRQWKDKKGENTQEWSFRHDKIMEFFVVQTFMSSGNEGVEKRKKHMGDPRFRGIYLLLARLLPLNDALTLRENLIQYAADTQDHTVSDAYVQLMRSRC